MDEKSSGRMKKKTITGKKQTREKVSIFETTKTAKQFFSIPNHLFHIIMFHIEYKQYLDLFKCVQDKISLVIAII